MATIYEINCIAARFVQANNPLTESNRISMINEVIASISDSYCVDEATFKYILRFMTLTDYMNFVLARNSKGRCAYALCQEYLTSTNQSIDDGAKYCSPKHMDYSRYVQTQLSSSIEENNQRYQYHAANLVSSDRNVHDIILFEELLRNAKTEQDIDLLIGSLGVYHT